MSNPLDADRRQQLLAKREALQKEIKRHEEIERIKLETDQLEARGVRYRVLHVGTSEQRILLDWYRATFPSRRNGLPDWSQLGEYVPGPPDHDPDVDRWLLALARAKGLGSSEVVVIADGGRPYIVLGFSDLVTNLDVLRGAFEQWIMCKQEGWVIAVDADDGWGWGRP